MNVVVIGTGLIGTSVALALRGKGCAVWLADADRAAARLAADLGAGDLLPDALDQQADVAGIARPPAPGAAPPPGAPAPPAGRRSPPGASGHTAPVGARPARRRR